MPDRNDDPAIAGNVFLYRRIPNRADRVNWESTPIVPSSLNFKDQKNELSMNLASETTPEIVLAGELHSGFGLVSISAGKVRELCGLDLKICRDEITPGDGHIILCMNISNTIAKKLSRASRWVLKSDGTGEYLPIKPDPN